MDSMNNIFYNIAEAIRSKINMGSIYPNAFPDYIYQLANIEPPIQFDYISGINNDLTTNEQEDVFISHYHSKYNVFSDFSKASHYYYYDTYYWKNAPAGISLQGKGLMFNSCIGDLSGCFYGKAWPPSPIFDSDNPIVTTVSSMYAGSINYNGYIAFNNFSYLRHISAYTSRNNYFTSPFNFINCHYLQSAMSMVTYCNNFNGSIIFGEQYDIKTRETPYHTNDPYINYLETPVTRDYSSMLQGCRNFNQPIDFNLRTTTQYTWLNDVLSGCINFNSSIIFGSDKVASLNGFFYNCQKYNKPITIPKNAIYLNMTFYNCINFNYPIIIPDDTLFMQYMFDNCTKFNQTIYINKPVNLASTFYNCIAFHSSVYIKNTTNLINVTNMFYNCRTFSIYAPDAEIFKTNDIIGKGILTWTEVVNGYYNSMYRIYVYNNYS